MKLLRPALLLVVITALALAVLAPAAFASAGVSLKLKGPSQANNGAAITLTLTILNPQGADGASVAMLMQNKNSHLRWIGDKGIKWTNGGQRGTVVFKVKAVASAGATMFKYKAQWMHPMGVTFSNALNIPVTFN